VRPGTGQDHLMIGIDIGGTGVKGGVVDLASGTLRGDRVKIATPHPATPPAVADTVRQVVDQLGTDGAVGITVPAVVRARIVETASNIDPAWIGTDAVALFTRVLGRPVAVLNDAAAAGLAVLITLGTGIGSAVFVDGILVPNTELGHLPLHHGDAEDWAAESARERDDLSWKQFAHRLERYLQLVERLLWPNLFIIGGGVSKSADRFLPRIKLRTHIVPAMLHNDAGIVGAAMCAPTGDDPDASAGS
jgi:polyphosphate glucokinase